jgi:hypothetical protein
LVIIALSALLGVGVIGTVQEVSGIQWPLTEQSSPHAINKTYGDWNGDRFYVDSLGCHIAYHTGVDIPADSGTAVRAVFNGYVTDARTFTDTLAHLSYITIARTLGGNPSWHYGHVIPCSTMTESTFVSLGDTLGFVAAFRPNLSNCHLHFYFEEVVGNLTESVCNPLDSLVPAPSQDADFAERLPGI